MTDFINIKAINRDLYWNQSIAELMEKVQYSIDFAKKEISLRLARGLLNEDIEFINCEIGTYETTKINGQFFNKLKFDLLTPKEKVWEYVENNSAPAIKIEYDGGRKLEIFYIGNNPTLKSNIPLLSDTIKLDFEKLENWKFKIQQVRMFLNNEFHARYFDHKHNKEMRYQWISFENLSIFGLNYYKFRGSYSPANNELTKIEAVIGSDISDYHNLKKILVSKFGNPIDTHGPKYNELYKHTFAKDIWHIKNLTMLTRSAAVSDIMRYEIEIMKTNRYDEIYSKTVST